MLGQKGIKLEIGQKVHYKNPSMPHPEATYEGIVVGEYPYFYRLYGSPIIETLSIKNKETLGENPPIPYYFTIHKYIDERSDRVCVVKDSNAKTA